MEKNINRFFVLYEQAKSTKYALELRISRAEKEYDFETIEQLEKNLQNIKDIMERLAKKYGFVFNKLTFNLTKMENDESNEKNSKRKK